MHVTPRVTLVKGKTANRYLIEDKGTLTLVDTGLPGQEKGVFQAIQKMGYKTSDLTKVVVTHADFDHYGCLQAIRDGTQAKVYASQIEAEAIRKGEQSRSLKPGFLFKVILSILSFFYPTKPVRADRMLQEGDVLPGLGGIEVIETPGHTPGHISLFSDQQRILFSGDALRASQEGKLMPSHGVNTWDEKLAWESVKKIANREPEIICCGHGPVINDENALPSLLREHTA